ncbi:ATP-dependent RNA helicase dbp2 [Kalmusia sp. IMI 367209]|nr:ATP-dependent RNA helicase dbp2 [Kalmusia sp. IMI 367209]
MTATTALTAQNTLGVQDIHHTPPPFLKKQIDACIEDIGVDVVKTGKYARIDRCNPVHPNNEISRSDASEVMVSTSGSALLPTDAVSTLIESLLPLTTLLTPNLPEAELLLKIANKPFKSPENIDDIISLAKTIQGLGPKYVLVKGGHLPMTKGRLVSKDEAEKHVVLNVLLGNDDDVTVMETKYLKTAIACNLALGMDMKGAVRKANLYIEAGIKTSVNMGSGSGPINHFHSTYTLPFAPGGFIDYLLDREDVQEPWERYTHHDFVQRMADGTLPVENFKHYLIQDYLFLIHFARANALASYKSKSMTDIGRSAQQVLHLQEEIKLHIDFCKDYGLTPEDLEQQEEDQACTAYTRYVLDIGQSEDWIALQIALLPCLIGYGIIAQRLYNDTKTVREGSKYWKWVETYVADDYAQAMEVGRAIGLKDR